MRLTGPRRRARRGSALGSVAVAASVVALALPLTAVGAVPAWADPPAPPSPCPGADGSVLGPNVCVFNDSMSQATIQADLNAIAAQQVPNQFGSQRYAVLFEPGTYGTSANPLNFQVGYYTEVAGLGATPGDVVINGSVDVYNQCSATNDCVALDNFWRSVFNLTINSAANQAGCYTGEFWAVSQAAPMRRVIVNGPMTLMDYCTSPSFASGGFIADSEMSASVVNGSQQQFLVRNSNLGGWSNGVWNQVFSGVNGAPATCFPAASACGGPYTTLNTSPVTQEPPFLTAGSGGSFGVSVPSLLTNSAGPGWAGGADVGSTLPLQKFLVATPGTPLAQVNQALARGKNLILTPGVYDLSGPIQVSRPNTIVLGLGFATLVPQAGEPALVATPNNGVKITGLIIDAGPVTSPSLLSLGTPGPTGNAPGNPDVVSDVFFRIGGAAAGSAQVSFVDNASNSVLDDIWAWRADHGNPGTVGWTVNTADTGLEVNGANVTAYGLFVEHYQKNEVIWSGSGGTDIFFQNEMPYDPPSQSAWMASPAQDGYPALLVTSGGTGFQGWGMGSYSFFNQGVNIYSAMAFQSPTSGVSFHDLLTIFLNSTAGFGGIRSVINGVGGSSTIANPDTPVTVVSYP
jgi:hypothetical protein